MKSVTKRLPVLLFRDRKSLAGWLKKNASRSKGFLLKIGKKGAGIKTVTYDEALDEAVIYGWIDSMKLAFNGKFYLQRFTPRKKGGLWSAANRKKAEKLIREGKMNPQGMLAVEDAKKTGRWERAYEGQSTMDIPADLGAALEKDIRARKFFDRLDRLNRYSVLFRIQKVKRPEARKEKILKFVRMLHEGLKIHDGRDPRGKSK